MNGSSEFDKSDLDLLADAQRESAAEDAAALAEAQQAEETPAAAPAAAPAPAPTPAAPAPAAPAAPAAAPAAQQVEVEDEHKGSLRAALRAARFSERRLRAENEALRQGTAAPAAAPSIAQLDESTIEDLKTYAPKAAERLAALEAETERLRKIAEKVAPTPAEQFVPDTLDDDLQDMLDEIPELDKWRTTPELQDKWRAVGRADSFLATTDAHKGKGPTIERFRAAMAMVQAQPVAPSPPAPVPPKDQARAKIDALPISQPVPGVGGLRSGENPGLELPNFHQMVKDGKTDEDIIASLS